MGAYTHRITDMACLHIIIKISRLIKVKKQTKMRKELNKKFAPNNYY